MNPIGQLLLPICGNPISYLDHTTSLIDVRFNNKNYYWIDLIVLDNSSLSKIFTNIEEFVTMDMGGDDNEYSIYTFECIKYKETFNYICEGLFSKVNREVFEFKIAPYLYRTRDTWKGIFSRDINILKRYIKNKTKSPLGEDAAQEFAEILLNEGRELHKPLNNLRE